MSAWMPTRSHFLTLAHYAMIGDGLRWRKFAPATDDPTRRELYNTDDDLAAELASILSAECAASLRYRYPNDDTGYCDDPGPFTAADLCRFAPYAPTDPVAIIKACHCLAYQSCEHPEWEDSEARRIVDAIIAKATHRLPGYDSAPWGFDDIGPEDPTFEQRGGAPVILLTSLVRKS